MAVLFKTANWRYYYGKVEIVATIENTGGSAAYIGWTASSSPASDITAGESMSLPGNTETTDIAARMSEPKVDTVVTVTLWQTVAGNWEVAGSKKVTVPGSGGTVDYLSIVNYEAVPNPPVSPGATVRIKVDIENGYYDAICIGPQVEVYHDGTLLGTYTGPNQWIYGYSTGYNITAGTFIVPNVSGSLHIKILDYGWITDWQLYDTVEFDIAVSGGSPDFDYDSFFCNFLETPRGADFRGGVNVCDGDWFKATMQVRHRGAGGYFPVSIDVNCGCGNSCGHADSEFHCNNDGDTYRLYEVVLQGTFHDNCHVLPVGGPINFTETLVTDLQQEGTFINIDYEMMYLILCGSTDIDASIQSSSSTPANPVEVGDTIKVYSVIKNNDSSNPVRVQGEIYAPGIGHLYGSETWITAGSTKSILMGEFTMPNSSPLNVDIYLHQEQSTGWNWVDTGQVVVALDSTPVDPYFVRQSFVVIEYSSPLGSGPPGSLVPIRSGDTFSAKISVQHKGGGGHFPVRVGIYQQSVTEWAEGEFVCQNDGDTLKNYSVTVQGVFNNPNGYEPDRRLDTLKELYNPDGSLLIGGGSNPEGDRYCYIVAKSDEPKVSSVGDADDQTGHYCSMEAA